MPHTYRLSIFTAILSIAALRCSNSPTEPSPLAKTGTLILMTQPCGLSGSVELVVGGVNLGPVAVPGETRFTVPAGRQNFGFLRNGTVFSGSPANLADPGSGGVLIIPDGGSVTLANPPGVCMSVPNH